MQIADDGATARPRPAPFVRSWQVLPSGRCALLTTVGDLLTDFRILIDVDREVEAARSLRAEA